MRVIRWIIDRCKGTAAAHDTAIGYLPTRRRISTRAGSRVAPAAIEELLAVSPQLWQAEFEGIGDYLAEFGERLPQALAIELRGAIARVAAP